jgi:polysaccharide biosynthesis transport protein
MDIIAYIFPLKKWWWLLIAATLLAAATSFIATARQPKVYQSRTTLIIGKAISEPNPTSGEFYLGEQLASMYADMVSREPIRNATMEALGIDWLPKYNAQALANTQLIEISVSDTVPNRAQAVAAELAHQLILQSPSGVQSDDQAQQGFINSQLATLQKQIQDTQAEIEKQQLKITTLNSARDIADTQSQITSLENKLATLRTTYASLASSTNRDATNSLTIIEPADLPSVPISPNPLMIVGLASTIGFVLACLGAYAIEALDDSIKSEEEISKVLDVPIVGHIPTFNDEENRWGYIYKNPRSPIADAFRMMRTNIDFLSIDNPIKSILLTSPNIAEGKSTIACNLAFSFAQIEKKVILVDADFRRPVLHSAAQVPNDIGLSDLFLGKVSINDVLIPWFDGLVNLLPAGILPLNPTELMGSKMMEVVQSNLKKMADIVIIDSPPLILADSLILSKKVDGVLLVVRFGRTRKKSLQAVKKLVAQSGTKIFGIVINQSNQGDSYYYNHYYSADQGTKEAKPSLFDYVTKFQPDRNTRKSNNHIDLSHENSSPTPPFIEAENEIKFDAEGFPEFASLTINSANSYNSSEGKNEKNKTIGNSGKFKTDKPNSIENRKISRFHKPSG